VGKRRAAVIAFDSTIEARLRAVSPYDLVAGPGTCEIHFAPLLGLANGLPEFQVSWFVTSPRRTLPAPNEELFALWDRYRAVHVGLCTGYRQLLFGLFSRSTQAGYDDHQWRQLRRSRPTARDLRSVVDAVRVRLAQWQAQGEPSPVFEVQAEFEVFWDEHGVAVRLRESGEGFSIGEWSGIGDL
jgi:hypothetical protein